MPIPMSPARRRDLPREVISGLADAVAALEHLGHHLVALLERHEPLRLVGVGEHDEGLGERSRDSKSE